LDGWSQPDGGGGTLAGARGRRTAVRNGAKAVRYRFLLAPFLLYAPLAAGFAIMSASKIAAGLLLIPSAVIYPNVIAREEEHLSRLFPEDFRLYQSKVPRFFPRLTLRLHPAFSLRQYVANGEYNTVLGFAAAVAVLVGKWYVST